MSAKWKMYIHPDGKPYYVGQYGPRFRVITDDNIAQYDDNRRNDLEGWGQLFYTRTARLPSDILCKTEIELYLSFIEEEHHTSKRPKTSRSVPYYYLVNRTWGQVFWDGTSPNLWIDSNDSLGKSHSSTVPTVSHVTFDRAYPKLSFPSPS
jgi:hypothetical protein